MQSVSSRIWTRIAMFISYGDNDNTTGTVIFTGDDFFSKHNNIGRSAWTAMGTILKNKPFLVTFYGSILISLWTFQPTIVYTGLLA